MHLSCTAPLSALDFLYLYFMWTVLGSCTAQLWDKYSSRLFKSLPQISLRVPKPNYKHMEIILAAFSTNVKLFMWFPALFCHELRLVRSDRVLGSLHSKATTVDVKNIHPFFFGTKLEMEFKKILETELDVLTMTGEIRHCFSHIWGKHWEKQQPLGGTDLSQNYLLIFLYSPLLKVVACFICSFAFSYNLHLSFLKLKNK